MLISLDNYERNCDDDLACGCRVLRDVIDWPMAGTLSVCQNELSYQWLIFKGMYQSVVLSPQYKKEEDRMEEVCGHFRCFITKCNIFLHFVFGKLYHCSTRRGKTESQLCHCQSLLRNVARIAFVSVEDLQ